MKKTLSLILTAALSLTASAQQTIIEGDMSHDGKLTIEDVTLLTENLLTNVVSALDGTTATFSSDGYYWTSTFDEWGGLRVSFGNGVINGSGDRGDGCSIRPVFPYEK